MVQNKIIDHKVFSLYLSDAGTEESTIVFGGYDRKYMLNPKDEVINFLYD